MRSVVGTGLRFRVLMLGIAAATMVVGVIQFGDVQIIEGLNCLLVRGLACGRFHVFPLLPSCLASGSLSLSAWKTTDSSFAVLTRISSRSPD